VYLSGERGSRSRGHAEAELLLPAFAALTHTVPSHPLALPGGQMMKVCSRSLGPCRDMSRTWLDPSSFRKSPEPYATFSRDPSRPVRENEFLHIHSTLAQHGTGQGKRSLHRGSGVCRCTAGLTGCRQPRTGWLCVQHSIERQARKGSRSYRGAAA
jgi:hypothetical protein